MYGTDMYVMEETIMVVYDTVNDKKSSNGNKDNFFAGNVWNESR